jgi:hypothetical protein
LELFQLKAGLRRSIRKAKLDPQLLNQPKIKRKVRQEWLGEQFKGALPAFCLEEPHLRFPKPNHSATQWVSECRLSNGHLVALSEDRRLLYWDDARRAALELANDLPIGKMILHDSDKDDIALFIQPPDAAEDILLYYFDYRKGEQIMLSKLGHIRIFADSIRLASRELWFRARDIDNIEKEFKWSPNEGMQLSNLSREMRASLPDSNSKRTKLKQWIKQTGSMFSNHNSVGITSEGRLKVANKVLEILPGPSQNSLHWRQNEHPNDDMTTMQLSFQAFDEEGREGDLRYLRPAKTQNGAFVFADRRGFIHLKSSRSELPEVSIITLVGAATTAWASDGRVTGNSYFLHGNQFERGRRYLAPADFYEIYIKPILAEMR